MYKDIFGGLIYSDEGLIRRTWCTGDESNLYKYRVVVSQFTCSNYVLVQVAVATKTVLLLWQIC